MDPRYPQYPRLPVLQCDGHQPTSVGTADAAPGSEGEHGQSDRA